MAGAEIAPRSTAPALLANPWPWMLTGLLSCALALLWTRCGAGQALLLTWLLVLAGAFSVGRALTLRLSSALPAYLETCCTASRQAVWLGLVLLCLLVIGSAFGLYAAAAADIDLPWTAEQLAPVCLAALLFWGGLAVFCTSQARAGQAISPQLEAALLLLLASLCAFVCVWALYPGQAQAADWDSMRLFFGVVSLVALLAAPLALLPPLARKLALSLLILLHFGGILTAVLNGPPASPWLARQIWARFYRPYLQFAYMNNNYHFYAPEPGPSSYMWYRIEYERPGGEHVWNWEIVPKVKPDGSPDYFMSLRYQRRLSLAEQVGQTEEAPPMTVPGSDGRTIINPIYAWRAISSDNPGLVLSSQFLPEPQYRLPFHPQVVPVTSQYRRPNAASQHLLSSYAAHACQMPHPQYADAKPVSVKVYRVTHLIPPPELVAGWRGPAPLRQLPTLLSPYYQGQFDTHGKLLDEPQFNKEQLVSGDPLLYWLTPILADNPANLSAAPIRAWIYKHAGDPNWVIYPGSPAPEAPRPGDEKK